MYNITHTTSKRIYDQLRIGEKNGSKKKKRRVEMINQLIFSHHNHHHHHSSSLSLPRFNSDTLDLKPARRILQREWTKKKRNGERDRAGSSLAWWTRKETSPFPCSIIRLSRYHHRPMTDEHSKSEGRERRIKKRKRDKGWKQYWRKNYAGPSRHRVSHNECSATEKVEASSFLVFRHTNPSTTNTNKDFRRYSPPSH